jgi:hypothetical protein
MMITDLPLQAPDQLVDGVFQTGGLPVSDEGLPRDLQRTLDARLGRPPARASYHLQIQPDGPRFDVLDPPQLVLGGGLHLLGQAEAATREREIQPLTPSA